MKKIIVTFHAPDENDEWCEDCFEVTVDESLRDSERDALIYGIASDMARLHGFPGYNVDVVAIEEETSK